MNTCEHDTPGIAGYLNCLTGGMFSGRTVNCAVHTALPSSVEDFLDGFLGFDHHVCANSTGQLATVGQGIYSPDACRLGGAQCGDRQKPDWSCTNYYYRFARMDRSQTDGVQRNCKRLSQGRLVERHPGRDGTKVEN